MSDVKSEKLELTSDQIDSLMETSLDEIENLPDYITPPTGFYSKLLVKKVDLKAKMKDKRCIRVTFVVTEPETSVELSNLNEVKPAEGSLFSVSYTPDTSVDDPRHVWRWVKKAYKGYLEFSGASNFAAGMSAMEGQLVSALVSSRPNEDKTQYFAQVDKVMPFIPETVEQAAA